KELKVLGWLIKNPNSPNLNLDPDDQERLLKDQGRVLKILQGKIENPAVRGRLDELLKEASARRLTLAFDLTALPILAALTGVKAVVDTAKRKEVEDFRPEEEKMGADLSALNGTNKTAPAYQAAQAWLEDLKEFHDAGGDKLLQGVGMNPVGM